MTHVKFHATTQDLFVFFDGYTRPISNNEIKLRIPWFFFEPSYINSWLLRRYIYSSSNYDIKYVI